jgi:hypothetical protein
MNNKKISIEKKKAIVQRFDQDNLKIYTTHYRSKTQHFQNNILFFAGSFHKCEENFSKENKKVCVCGGGGQTQWKNDALVVTEPSV